MAEKFKRWYCIEFEEITPDYGKCEVVHGPLLQPFVSNIPETQIEVGELVYFGYGSLTDKRKQAKIVFIHENEFGCRSGARKASECAECAYNPPKKDQKGKPIRVKYIPNTCRGKCRRVLNCGNLSKVLFESNKNAVKSINPTCSLTRKFAVLLTFDKAPLINCVFNLCNGCETCNADASESTSDLQESYKAPAESSGIPGINLAERNIMLPTLGNSIFIGRFWTEVLYLPVEKESISATAKDVAEMLVSDTSARISWTSRAMEFIDICETVQKFANVTKDVAIDLVETEYAAIFDKPKPEQKAETEEFIAGNNKEEHNREEKELTLDEIVLE